MPAGWYPDPKPADPTRPGERWWNGSEWTVSTRSDGATVYITGEPPAPKRRRLGRALVASVLVAAVVGAGIGVGSTYLVMHHDHSSASASAAPRSNDGTGNGGGANGGSGSGGGFGGGLPFGGSGGGSGSTGGSGGSGSSGGGSTGGSDGGSTGGGSGSSSNPGLVDGKVLDPVDGLSMEAPSGWTGGYTDDGYAYLSYGSYTCAGSTSQTDTCSLAGANTQAVKGSVSDVQAAAESDIASAASASYGKIKGHTQLEAKAVTVAGRQGYLIRWQVQAPVGNNGTVETVVFPDSTGKKLVALHLGFDISSKAPSVSLMDTLVASVKDYSGPFPGLSGSSGSGSGSGGGSAS